jgi:glucose/arabinose dehydrogenase
VSFGRTYQGPWHSQKFQREGFIDPIVYWMPSIAVSGLAFYTGDRLPKWKGDVFVGGLRTGEIIGTGQIQRILLNGKLEELRREALLTGWRHRMGDVRQGRTACSTCSSTMKMGPSCVSSRRASARKALTMGCPLAS